MMLRRARSVRQKVMLVVLVTTGKNPLSDSP